MLTTYHSNLKSKPIIVPDIHGCIQILEAILQKFPDREFIFLGDLIDRGKNNIAVINYVRQLVLDGRALLCKGNHEDMVFKTVVDNNEEEMYNWLINGGAETINEYVAAYGDDWKDYLSEDVHFLYKHMEEFIIHDDVLLSHASRPKLFNGTIIDPEYHIWNRLSNGNGPLPEGCRYSVHGHTPIKEPIVAIKQSGVVYIDLGGERSGRFCVFDTQTETTVNIL